jgi:6-phosphogluconate dehydrogenase
MFVGTLKMIMEVFLRMKVFGELSVEYLGSISGKNQRGSLGKYLYDILRRILEII